MTQSVKAVNIKVTLWRRNDWEVRRGGANLLRPRTATATGSACIVNRFIPISPFVSQDVVGFNYVRRVASASLTPFRAVKIHFVHSLTMAVQRSIGFGASVH